MNTTFEIGDRVAFNNEHTGTIRSSEIEFDGNPDNIVYLVEIDNVWFKDMGGVWTVFPISPKCLTQLTIKDISPGDTFYREDTDTTLTVFHVLREDKYYFVNSKSPHTITSESPRTKAEMIDFLSGTFQKVDVK